MPKVAAVLQSIFKFTPTVQLLEDFDYSEPVDTDDVLDEFLHPLVNPKSNHRLNSADATNTIKTDGAHEDVDKTLSAVSERQGGSDSTVEGALHDSTISDANKALLTDEPVASRRKKRAQAAVLKNNAEQPKLKTTAANSRSRKKRAVFQDDESSGSDDDEHVSKHDIPNALDALVNDADVEDVQAASPSSQSRKRAVFYDSSDDNSDNEKVPSKSSVLKILDELADDENEPAPVRTPSSAPVDAFNGDDTTGRRIEEIDELLKIFDDNRLAVDGEDEDADFDFTYKASNGRKAHVGKKGAARKSKTIAQESMQAKLAMQAETQRIERESAVRLPCHEPQITDLDSFLSMDTVEDVTSILSDHRYERKFGAAKPSVLDSKRINKARIREWHAQFMQQYGNGDIEENGEAEDSAKPAEESAGSPKEGSDNTGDSTVAPVETDAAQSDLAHVSADQPSPKSPDPTLKDLISEEAEHDGGSRRNDDGDEVEDADNDDDSFIDDTEIKTDAESDDEPIVIPVMREDELNDMPMNDEDAPVKGGRRTKKQSLKRRIFNDDDSEDGENSDDQAAMDEDEADDDEDEADDEAGAEDEKNEDDENSTDGTTRPDVAVDEASHDANDMEATADGKEKGKGRFIDKFIEDEAELSDADNYEAGSDDERDEEHLTEEQLKELEAMIDRDFDVSNDELYAQIMPLLKKQDEQMHRRILRKLRDQLVEDEDLYNTSEEDLVARKQRIFKWTSLLDETEDDTNTNTRFGRQRAAMLQQQTSTTSTADDDDARRIEEDIQVARERFEQRRHDNNSTKRSHSNRLRGGLRRVTAGVDADCHPAARRSRVVDDDEDDAISDDEREQKRKAADLKAQELEQRFYAEDAIKAKIDAGLRQRRGYSVLPVITAAQTINTAANRLQLVEPNNFAVENNNASRAAPQPNTLLSTPTSGKHARGSWLARNTNSLRRLHSVKFAEAPNYELGLFHHISPQQNRQPAQSHDGASFGRNNKRMLGGSPGGITSIPKTPVALGKRARLTTTITPGKNTKKLNITPQRTPGQMSIAKLLMKQKSGLDEFATP